MHFAKILSASAVLSSFGHAFSWSWATEGSQTGSFECENICQIRFADTGDSCLGGTCDMTFSEGEAGCSDCCRFSDRSSTNGLPPTSLTLESSDESLSDIDVVFYNGCSQTVANMNMNNGVSPNPLFFVEKKSCSMDDGNVELDPMTIIITDNEYNEIRTSCSQPLYLGQQFGSFTVVGYCVTGPAYSLQEEVCSGIYAGDNRETSSQPSTSPTTTGSPSSMPSENPSISATPSSQPSTTPASTEKAFEDKQAAIHAKRMRLIQAEPERMERQGQKYITHNSTNQERK